MVAKPLLYIKCRGCWGTPGNPIPQLPYHTVPNPPLYGKSGAVKWEYETGDSVTSTPAIGSAGIVYFGSRDGKIYALDENNGAKKWEFKTGARIHSSPVISPDGTLYIGSGDGKVYAIATSSKGPAKSPWPMHGQNARHTGRAK